MNRFHIHLVRLATIVLYLHSTIGTVLAAEKSAPAPLGFVIGEASLHAVRSQLKKKTDVRDAGINRYSQGPMLEANGEKLAVDDLKHALFIFNKDNQLVAVELTLYNVGRNGSFGRVFSHLSAKYTMVSQRMPFVGNKKARFESGETVILLDAPHMDFEMKVTYVTRDLEKRWQSQIKKDSEKRKHDMREQF